MKVFMVGWEFPPFISGGLGTACYGLTKAMDRLGLQITFVLPRANKLQYAGHVKMFSAQGFCKSEEAKGFKNVKFYSITSSLRPYIACGTYAAESIHSAVQQREKNIHPDPGCNDYLAQLDNYGGDIYAEVCRYANATVKIAEVEEFDIIHAHDWMTYPAGIAVKKISGKPLIVHVHSTEFDRSGEQVNQMIYDIERQGMLNAAKIITVSNYTRNIIVNRYGIPPEKVEVIYNGVEYNVSHDHRPAQFQPDESDKIVLFLGRITMQKGPEYFLAAAKKVLKVMSNVKFIVAGSGDMMHQTIELAAHLCIGHKVLFAGFLRGEDVKRAYQMADLYVMPSVSEPFGIAPLEALHENVPVLISKQSGIAEALTHALKVDFWDVNEMANKIIGILKYPPLHMTLLKNGHFEAHKFRWEDSAIKVRKIYEGILAA